MKKLISAGIVFLFVVSVGHAWDPNRHKEGPGYNPPSQWEQQQSQMRRIEQQQSWDSMQRQNEQNREAERRGLERSFEQIDRDMKRIYGD